MKRHSPLYGKSWCFGSSSRPRIALIEKDSDLLETGAMGIGVKRCERLPSNGSLMKAIGQNLLHSVQVVFFCYVQER